MNFVETSHGFVMQGYELSHKAILRDIDVLNKKILNIDINNKKEVKNFYNWFILFSTILSKHHYAEEKAYFPVLRVEDPEIADFIDSLSREHIVVNKTIEQINRCFKEVIKKPSLPSYQSLISRVHVFTRHVKDHAEKEDDILIPSTTIYVSPTKQEYIEEKVKELTPLSMAPTSLCWLLYGQEIKDKNIILKNLPLPIKWIYNKYLAPNYSHKWRKIYH